MKRNGTLRRAGGGCLVLAFGFAALSAQAEVSFTPRVGVYFDNASIRQPQADGASPEVVAYITQLRALFLANGGGVDVQNLNIVRSEQVAIPQFGGTLTFNFGAAPKSDFALTALYGKGHGRNEAFISEQFLNTRFPNGVAIVDTVTKAYTYDSDYKRLDLEATWQYRLNETFSWVSGLRAERTTGDRPTTQLNTLSTNALNYGLSQIGGPAFPFITPAALRIEQHLESWQYSLRGGVAAFVPVGERHLVYVNGLMQVNRNSGGDFTNYYPATNFTEKFSGVEGETSIGPDISVGYLFRFSDRFAIDWRYRATFYFPISGERDFKDSRVRHGTMLGFTTWFGDR